MFPAVLGSVFSLLPILLGMHSDQADGGKPASLGIFMDFESTPGEESVRAMEREVNQILESSGMLLDWRLARENRGTEPFRELVVLKFKGVCTAGLLSDPGGRLGSGESEVLASTKVDHGRVLPYSEVECDRVRQALAYLGPGAGQKERQRALGVALGRVVAHELYHILAGTPTHAERGIAKATHSLQELVASPRLLFRQEDLSAMSKASQ